MNAQWFFEATKKKKGLVES